MAARPSWEGHLRLSLVTCPVALWPATTEAETVRFNLINPKTNNRIRMQTLDAGTGEEVSRGSVSVGEARSAESAMYRAVAERWLVFEGSSLYRIRLTDAGRRLVEAR
jgi:non-homologous end joining protein Ku